MLRGLKFELIERLTHSTPKNRRSATRQSGTESLTSGAARAQEKISVALSQLKELGEEAVVAIAASLARGGPAVRGQLIASRFYEALRDELKQSPMHDTKRAALIAASDRCERIAAAGINPSAMLDELRKAIALLQADEHASVPPPPPRARPVLRLIEGGLSKI
jgi:hypothetical protein